MKVLIAEDERDLAEAYRVAFPKFGLEVVGVAFNGQEAVDLFRKHQDEIDIVVLDHRMPVMSGLDAAREILAIKPDVLVVFGSADSSIIEEAHKIGVRLVKKKPFTIRQLVDNIETLLRN